MDLITNFALLIGGIIVLILAGDWMVRGAAALARHWGVPALIVGLTIVAFGTSAPELVVSVQAVLSGASQLAAGNVVGSNITNILLVLGAPALIAAIPTNIQGVGRNAFICLISALVLMVFCFMGPALVFWQGAVLFGAIIAYLIWMFTLARAGADDPILADMADLEEGQSGLPANMVMSWVFVVLGVIGLVIGGNLIVGNATEIASAFGISETLIGLTIVAIGTSLPELATVVVAAYRSEPEMAIGNILGSNVFNTFAVMGASAMAGNVIFEDSLKRFDLWIMLVATIVLFAMVMRRQPIGRGMGAFLLAGYIGFLAVNVATLM